MLYSICIYKFKYTVYYNIYINRNDLKFFIEKEFSDEIITVIESTEA